MLNRGWKTVIVDKHVSLEYEQGNMLVKGEEVKSIPINQMKTLVINSQQARITSYLLTELCNGKVKVIFCNHQHNPASELVGYHDNCQSSSRINEQTKWRQADKELVWKKIVEVKIENQNRLLICKGFGNNLLLNRYFYQIDSGDPSNREGQAARVYFNTIFGKDFNRSGVSEINSMLNYGYAILLSAFNRVLTAYGYNTSLGIKHCSGFNPYNLSSDLMEPFRPYVDSIVYENIGRELDKEMKKELIGMSYMKLIYGGKRMEAQSAIELYAYNILQNIANTEFVIPTMEFVDER